MNPLLAMLSSCCLHESHTIVGANLAGYGAFCEKDRARSEGPQVIHLSFSV